MSITVLTFVVGCGGISPQPSDPGGPSSSTQPPASSQNATSGKPKSSGLIEWIVALGPWAPLPPAEPVPGSLTVYEMLLKGNCGSITGQAGTLEPRPRALYRGVAAACLGAFRGGEHQWKVANAALAEVQAGGEGHLYCWDQNAKRLLETLLRFHQQHPNQTIKRGRGKGESSCPRITRLEPQHGKPGDPLTIYGERLFNVSQVWFNYNASVPAPARSDPTGRRIEVAAIPAAGEPGESIIVWVYAGTLLDPAARFRFDKEPRPSDSPLNTRTPTGGSEPSSKGTTNQATPTTTTGTGT